MIIILYNPLSRNGSRSEVLTKVRKKAEKKFNEKTILTNFFDLDMDSFLLSLKDCDIVVLVGGDGTLNYAANFLKNKNINNKLYLYKAGTGNDFGRCFKEEFILLNIYLSNLPKFKLNNSKEEKVFINGCGIGVDGDTCDLVNNSSKKKNKINFFKSACKSFFGFKKMELEVSIDGKTLRFHKAWFITVMHGQYFGGGMKLAPDAIREDDLLEIVLINDISLFRLILLFPTIYIGKHYLCKAVKHYKGKNIKIKVLNGYYTEQHDGESSNNVNYLEINR